MLKKYMNLKYFLIYQHIKILKKNFKHTTRRYLRNYSKFKSKNSDNIKMILLIKQKLEVYFNKKDSNVRHFQDINKTTKTIHFDEKLKNIL